MAQPYYTEQGTGNIVTDYSRFDPSKMYLESGSGVTYAGSTLQRILGAPPPTSPAPIPVSTLTSSPTPMNVPSAPTQPGLSYDSLQSLINTQTQAQKDAQTAQTDLMKRLDEVYTKMGTQKAATTAALQAAGVPDLQKQQDEINAMILQKNSGAFSAAQNSEGRLAPTFAITGEQAQIERQRAAQTYGLAVQSQVLSGQIARAKETAQQAIEAEFGPLEKQADYVMKLLDLNKGTMDAADKAKADSLQLALSQYKDQISQQREEKSTALGLAASAISNYPNNKAAQLAYNEVLKLDPAQPGYLEKVYGLVGQYQTDPLDRQYKQAQINSANALANQRSTTGNSTPSEQLYSGLSNSTATAVRSKVSKFSTEPLVQNFQTIQEGYNFASSLSNTTTNPADDQALIYALAKALDPGSVVREGEYATAQKYSQSWIQSYGKGVTQALAGTGFLSETARKNIKSAIETKFNASKKSYDQVVSTYTNGINALTGRSDGNQFLTDYITPQTQGGSGTSSLPQSVQSQVSSNLTFSPDGSTAYLPRSVWSQLGPYMDAILAEAKADGVNLLIK